MKSLTAKILLAFYLLSFTPLKVVNRVPLLVVHYFQHLSEDKDLTIMEFFDIHYLHGIVMDDDYAQDMQLPFKNVQDFNNSTIITFQEINYPDFEECSVSFVFQNKLDTDADIFIPSLNDLGTFHPPRLV